jgi:hypothetical protein
MMMLGKLSFFWLMMAIVTVGLVSYFVSLMIDGVFGKDGFGTIGNMIVLTAGFFAGIVGAEAWGFHFRGLQMSTYVGVAGALALFTVLALCKLHPSPRDGETQFTAQPVC